MIASYPIISNLYYRNWHSNEIDSFISQKQALSQEEIQSRMEMAHLYNQTLDPSRLADPYSEEEEEAIAEYARMLELEEKIGYVEIPKIDQKIPVYAGTSDRVLNKAVGHLEGTSLPVCGSSTHSVITAHRGLP